MMIDDLSHEIRMLSVSKGDELAVDPDELLKKVPFFEGLPREEFRMVAGSLKRRTAPSGDVVVRQGDRGSSLFLVARGVIRVTRTDDGEERDIATLLAGNFFGEMALLHGGTRTATCRAVTPCALYELAREDVDALVKRAPAMKSALAEADRERRSELRQAGADLGEA
jgi:CPA1 family monovalent cation:H+ antiporter